MPTNNNRANVTDCNTIIVLVKPFRHIKQNIILHVATYVRVESEVE